MARKKKAADKPAPKKQAKSTVPRKRTAKKTARKKSPGKKAAGKKATRKKAAKKAVGKKSSAALQRKRAAKKSGPPVKSARPEVIARGAAVVAPQEAPVVLPGAVPPVPPPGAAGQPAPAGPATQAERPLTPDEVRQERTSRWNELNEQRTRAEQVFQRCQDALLARADVTGVNVGLKQKNGQIVSPLQYCIRVHVAHKLPEGHPMLLNKLSTEIEGIPVDVVERSYSTAAGADPAGRFVNPMCGGIPIANQNSPEHFGTLGVMMFSAGQPRYLTNQHVVGSPPAAGSPPNPVRQPPNGQTPAGMDANIGNVFDSERSEEIDAAIIAPTGNRTCRFGVIGHDGVKINGRFSPGVLTVADEHVTQCFKIGAMTGSPDLLGVVSNTSSSIKIDGFGVMKNQIVVESEEGVNLIEPGDSGSILIAPKLDPDGKKVNLVVGLVHARRDNDGAIIACHLNKVEARFNISLFNSTIGTG